MRGLVLLSGCLRCRTISCIVSALIALFCLFFPLFSKPLSQDGIISPLGLLPPSSGGGFFYGAEGCGVSHIVDKDSRRMLLPVLSVSGGRGSRYGAVLLTV